MYLLYQWVVHLGCNDFCNECNGHNNNNNNNDVRGDCELCNRRRDVTRHAIATNTQGKMKGKRVKVNRPDKDMYNADVFSVHCPKVAFGSCSLHTRSKDCHMGSVGSPTGAWARM